MLFLVTTSLCQDWVIYAPAAFLRSGSRFSAPLSRIEPQFSVTHHCHGRPIPYHRKLIGQILERLVAKSDQYFIMNHQEHNRSWKVWNLINTTLHKSGLHACISSRITKGIHIMTAIKKTFTVLMSHSQCYRLKVDTEIMRGLIFETNI